MTEQNPVQKFAASTSTRVFVLEAIVIALAHELADPGAIKRVEALVNLAIENSGWGGVDSVSQGLDAKDQVARLFEVIQSLPRPK